MSVVREVPREDVVVEMNVPATMRDGTVLRANVYRPQGDGPWPVLLARLPYSKDAAFVTSMLLDAVSVARSGFLVVFQDTRGFFTSDGDTMPFRYEREDGYDSVEWAARLPGANGRVVMFGASYLGNSQWAAASQKPPSLVAIAPMMTWANPLNGLVERGGAFELGLDYAWSLTMTPDYVSRLPLSDEDRGAKMAEVLTAIATLHTDGYWDLPARAAPTVAKYEGPQLGGRRYRKEPERLDWPMVEGRHGDIAIPTLHTAGWNDIFVQGTLDNYVAMAELGTPARLIVGPWSHINYTDTIGDIHYGLMANRGGAPAHPYGDAVAYQLAWSRKYGDPDSDISLPDTPVRLFVMGRNEWRDENEWPLARARNEKYHLHADGSLSQDRSAAGEGASEFTYDPADPAPTIGGPLVMSNAFRPGPIDQRPLEARDDVCVFTSEPLVADLEVTGRIRVVLTCQSSAPSTDWVARLCDVYPDGRSINIVDGITRIDTGADAVQQVEIDLWSTSNVFLAGHRLRVHVTSSSFPRWDRNLNTGEQDDPHFVTAHQRIIHDGAGSFIELPIVP